MREIFILLLLFNIAKNAFATCAFESDFGFTLNCNFKKSGLFRVKNLGGLKGYFGFGFSLGDELGFPESISTLESERRRALNVREFNLIGSLPAAKDHDSVNNGEFRDLKVNRNGTLKNMKQNLMTVASSLPLGVPAFRPIPQTSYNSERRKDYVNETHEKREVNNWLPKNHVQNQNADKEELLVGNYSHLNTLIESTHINEYPQKLSKHGPRDGVNLKSVTQRVALKKTNKNEDSVFKVMNAPKEYYPLGYDKNYDDNFKSKVDLPRTNFTCKNQTHFPGLYADTDLNCMVFHVCALTDEGIVRKSFLCPESTLFDQTVLKCNWWFYIDCYNSHNVYDSNIPVSKSYQLIKSLTYFSKPK